MMASKYLFDRAKSGQKLSTFICLLFLPFLYPHLILPLIDPENSVSCISAKIPVELFEGLLYFTTGEFLRK